MFSEDDHEEVFFFRSAAVVHFNEPMHHLLFSSPYDYIACDPIKGICFGDVTKKNNANLLLQSLSTSKWYFKPTF